MLLDAAISRWGAGVDAHDHWWDCCHERIRPVVGLSRSRRTLHAKRGWPYGSRHTTNDGGIAMIWLNRHSHSQPCHAGVFPIVRAALGSVWKDQILVDYVA